MPPLGDRLERPEDYAQAATAPVMIVLEDIRSGVNVGSFFRTADALRLAGLALCGYTAHPPHKDILKTALGASDHVPWRAFQDAKEAMGALRSEGYRIAAVEQTASSIDLTTWLPEPGERWALVFGNEVRGVQDATCDAADLVLELPQFGVKQSLNVSVCGGIALWHAVQHIGRP
jgi:tRNA G18 (ribose-2'-O)-methylase SpoU